MIRSSEIPKKKTWSVLFTSLATFALALLLSFGTGSVAKAAGTVQFLTPPDGSVATIGTEITPTGIAQGTSTGGTGLDLALVIDTSGSMSGERLAAAKAAAIALVNALPASTTSVSIIEFNWSASTVSTLTPLIPASNIDSLETAINSLIAGGGTYIGDGIDAAAAELLGTNATAGRSAQMVVLSDGVSSGDPVGAATDAVNAGVDAVHAIGIPGHNVAQMQAIASAGNGIYTAGNLDQLVSIFNGTGGNLVGVDKLVVELPDGTIIDPNALSDGLGNFVVQQGYNIVAGANTWTVTAFFSDGTQKTDTVTVYGREASVVPLPAALPMLLGAFGLLGGLRLRRRNG